MFWLNNGSRALLSEGIEGVVLFPTRYPMMSVIAVPIGKCHGQAKVMYTGSPSDVFAITAMLIIVTIATARPT